MTKKEKKEAKQRIYEAATQLFARKGYAAVSVREISKKANVNISMLNYYYGGKLGILRAILNEFYDKYYSAVLDVDFEHLEKEGLIRQVIKNLITFYRKNIELATAAHNVFAVDLPEVADLEMKWVANRRKQINQHFIKFGLNTVDNVTMTVMRGLVSTIIATHFQNRYAWQYTEEACQECSEECSENIKEFVGEEMAPEMNDEFYENYAEKLAIFYLYGLEGVTGRREFTKGGDNE